MKRWLPFGALAVLAVAGTVYVLGPDLFRRTKSPPANINGPANDPFARQIEAAVNKGFAEFNTGATLPSAEARKAIQEMAALGRRGQALLPLLEAWLKRMNDKGHSTSAEFTELAQAMVAIEPEAPARAVAAYLREPRYELKLYPTNKLLAFGPAALPAVAEGLRQEFEPPGDLEREAASQLPFVLATFGADAFPAIRAALRDQSPPQRRQAIRALAFMKPDIAAPALPDLEAAAVDKDPSVRTFAVLALGDLWPRDRPPSVAFSALLQDPDPLVRLAACHALSRNPSADPERLGAVVLALLKNNTLADTWWPVGDNSIAVVHAMRSSGVRYSQVYWEETAAHVLIYLGPRALPPADKIVDLLRACPHDGQHLVHLLLAQGTGAKEAVPGLVAMVKSESVWQRRKALWALGRLPAPVAADAMPVIRAALDDPDGRTRWRAFVTLCQHDPAAAREKLPPAWQDAVDAASSRGPDFAAIKTWCQCNWHRKHAVLQPATSFEVLATDLTGPHTFGDVEGLFEQGRLEGTLTALEKAARQGPAGTRFLVAVFQTASRDQWSRERFGVRALRLLEREGPGAAAAAPVLVDSLNAYLGHEAMAQALLAIGDPAVEALAAALRDPERRPLGLLAMVQRFGPRGKLASPAVLHCLQ